jgi:hypothetical protein
MVFEHFSSFCLEASLFFSVGHCLALSFILHWRSYTIDDTSRKEYVHRINVLSILHDNHERRIKEEKKRCNVITNPIRKYVHLEDYDATE